MLITMKMVEKAIDNTITELVRLASPRATEPHFVLSAWHYGESAVSIEGEKVALTLFSTNLAVLMAQTFQDKSSQNSELVNVKHLTECLVEIADSTQMYDEEFIVDGAEFQILLNIATTFSQHVN